MIVALVILLSPVAILYGLMKPRDPHFEYKFLVGQKPMRIGFTQDMGGGANGSEWAEYRWKEPFSEVVKRAKAELKGWKVESTGSTGPKDKIEFATFDGGHGKFVEVYAQDIPNGIGMYFNKNEVNSPNAVVVLVGRHLPDGLFSELRVMTFKSYP